MSVRRLALPTIGIAAAALLIWLAWQLLLQVELAAAQFLILLFMMALGTAPGPVLPQS